MNFKPIQFFSLLAGLLVSVCGAEVKADNLPSGLHPQRRSAELSVVTTHNSHTDLSFNRLLEDEKEILKSDTSGQRLFNLLSGDAIDAGVQSPLNTDGPDTTATSAADSLGEVSSPVAPDEAGLSETELSETVLGETGLGETGLSETELSEIARAAEEASLKQMEGSQTSENVLMPSEAFPYEPSHNPLLLADGGAPDFGDTLYWSPSRPDSHAPIGVMGDHTHGKGEFMLSYRYMFMDMDGNRSGTDSVSEAEVLQDFMVTPVQMTMQMHMLGAMYAPTEDLTLMAMLPYVTKEMDHLTRNGMRFTTSSSGIGDVSLGGLYTLLDRDRQRVHLNLGVSFPTGSIGERDATPMGPNQILPYPMQIGSGTFDFQPGVTYLGQAGRWSWGSQAMGKIRVGENANGYRLGNQFMLTGWGAHSWTDWFSTSLRLDGRTQGNITGADARLNPSVIPTAAPNLRAGTQLDVGLGLNFYVPEGEWQGTRFAVEFNLPVYRALSGPQLETDFTATAGLQTSF